MGAFPLPQDQRHPDPFWCNSENPKIKKNHAIIYPAFARNSIPQRNVHALDIEEDHSEWQVRRTLDLECGGAII